MPRSRGSVNLARDYRGGGRLRADQVDARVLRARPAQEIAVGRAEGDAPRRGLWLLPMQKPQAFSMRRAPAADKNGQVTALGEVSRTCLEPGAMTKLTSGWTTLPRRISATVARSRKDEFVQLPMQTCWTGKGPDVSYGGDVVRAVRVGRQGLKRREIDRHGPVVDRVGVGR